ncbi:TolC family protein [Sulfuriflexus sp.]|uniref:TolC family protein n=1 Tax=Sulfuriflexus sp. TaxID=2015443 RepID=UPI0028CBD81D|nr:TolC family protein [Sulfuriflexus sp.]MDT8403591.1 TolC family protein [Sulfuriflexus sp.]
MSVTGMVCGGLLLVLAGTSALVSAEDEAFTMPATITLDFALQQADSTHPELEQARVAIELAESERLNAEALTGTNVSIDAQLIYVNPNSSAQDQRHDDHIVSLLASKNLYDFGRSAAAEKAAAAAVQGEQKNLIDVRNQRRLEIMQRYFDTLLADLAYLRDNEDMAVAFIQFDKARDRREVGQVSDIEVLNEQNGYQQIRLKRYRSEARQRSARARLALAMNRPNQLPANLQTPELSDLQRERPELEVLQEQARKNNPLLHAARARLVAAQARVDEAHASDNPVLSGEFEASDYNRAFGSRDDVRIGLRLNIPLTDGGRNKADVAKQRARLRQARASYAEQQRKLEQVILETWLELGSLSAQLDQATAQLNYTELYLDQRRALYELEAQANLGDAMVQISEAQRYMAETRFKTAMAWARLDALLGNTVYAQAPVATGEGK